MEKLQTLERGHDGHARPLPEREEKISRERTD
jgi:hypothetical protein